MKTKREKQEQALAWREKELSLRLRQHTEAAETRRKLSLEQSILKVKTEIDNLRRKLGLELP